MSAWDPSGAESGTDDPRRFVIGASEEAQISTLCQIAKHNGSVLNLSELIDATSMPTNEEELQVAWSTNPTLSSRYSLEAGWVVERDRASSGVEGAVERANWSRARSAWNITQAIDFARLCVRGEVSLLAVSGGNSYDRAGPADDVDLFCVTDNDSMWLFMLRSLLLARAFRLRRRHTAPFCFSYVVEEECVREDFARKEGGLFARDALMARVIHGQDFYERLLGDSPWMGEYFPNLYAKRVGEAVPTGPQGAGSSRRGGWRAVANSFLFYTVGSYIKLKAYLLNGKYRRVGNISAVFRADIGKGRCVYESNRYRRLRRMYGGQPPCPQRGQNVNSLVPQSGGSIPISAGFVKLVTKGRSTGLPHVVVTRFVFDNGAFFLLAGKARSDWVLNSLGRGVVKVRIGELSWEGSVSRAEAGERSHVLDLFARKYGRRLTEEWYSKAEICAKIVPRGAPSRRGASGGEAHVRTTLQDWRNGKIDYYQAVAEAFDSASEEYDFTIRRNFINSWIRERSIRELLAVTKKEDFLLEIGCGTGTEAIQIAKRVRGVLGTDISPEMIALLERKVEALGLQSRIKTMKVGASRISLAAERLPGGATRVAYSFNGALNCEPDIREVPSELSRVISPGGYFVCSIRNSFCLSEALAHGLVLQMDKLTPRKKQPIMVSVGGRDIPSYYYRPSEFVRFFRPHFVAKRIMGLPAFLPPAYLSDLYFRARRVLSILERTETAAAASFPFNRFGDQTLFVFQKS